MLIEYMKKHSWVIITVLLTVLAIFVIGLMVEAAPAHEREFHGTFINSTGGVTDRYLYQASQEGHNIRADFHFYTGCCGSCSSV